MDKELLDATIFNLYVALQKKYKNKWELKRELEKILRDQLKGACSSDVADKIVAKNVHDFFSDRTMRNLKYKALDYDFDSLDVHFDVYTGQNYKEVFFDHIREMLKSIDRDMGKCYIPDRAAPVKKNGWMLLFMFIFIMAFVATFAMRSDEYSELSFMDESI